MAANAADPARRIGKYVLTGELGRGGMGAVFAGYDLSLGRRVAIKTLLHATSADEQTRRRFEREARAAARLRHPAIVAVHEVGEHARTPFLVMDLIDGEALDEVLRRGPLPPRRAAELAGELARALEHAHTAGIVHRDVKPQNVLLDRDGRPHLTDFGLARPCDASGITRSGAFLGTPGYAAPEQVSGDLSRVGPRSDVYGLGALLYHAITGSPPFPGQGAMEVLYASMRKDPVPPRRREPAVHADLETIVLCCLEKEPERRYASAAALAADLARFEKGEPILSRPLGRAGRAARWVRRHRALATAGAAGGLLLVAGAIGAAGFVQRRAESAARGARDDLIAAALARSQASLHDFAKARKRLPADPSREQRDATIAAGLEALEAASQWRRLAPESTEAREHAFDVAMTLGAEATVAGQWSVAGRAFSEAAELGVDDARARRALAGLERQRDRVGRERRETVEALLAQARSGELARRGGYDDALFTLVGLREPQTAEVLGAALDEVSAALRAAARDALLAAAEPTDDERRAGQLSIAGLDEAVDLWLRDEAALTEQPRLRRALDEAGRRIERRASTDFATGREWRELVAAAQARALGDGPMLLARLCCEALGRLGLPRLSLAPLERYLAAELDQRRAAHAGAAVALLGGEDADRIVRASRGRFGVTGTYWARVRRELERVRAGGDAPPDGESSPPATATALFERGLDRLATGDAEGALEDFTAVVERDPDLAKAWVNRGIARDELGDREGALADLTEATRRDPDLAIAWSARGVVLTERGDLDGARSDFERALAIDRDLVTAWNGRGKLRSLTGDLPGALADLDRAIELDPTYTAPFTNRAVVYRRLGRLDAALADAERAIALDDDDPAAWGARAMVRRARGDLDGAIEDATRSIDLDPDGADSYNTRGLARLDARDLPGSIADFSRAIEIDPDRAGPWSNRAHARAVSGELERALEDARRATSLPDADGAAWANLGNVRRVRGDARGAIEAYAKATELDPEDAGWWANLANARLDAGDLRGAHEDLTRVIALDASRPDVLLNRGLVRRHLGDLPGALEDFERAVALDPGSTLALGMRGQVRATLGDLAGALADLSTVVAREPNSARPLCQRALVHMRGGDTSSARSDLDRAIEIEPRSADAWLMRGQVRATAGDLAGGAEDLERALELAPSGPVAEQARATLEKIRRDQARAGGG